MPLSRFTKVATTDDLPPGRMRVVEVEGERILLVNVGGNYHAVSEACTHAEGPLSEGELQGERVSCPWHGSVFSVVTGEALTPPAEEPLRVYGVRVEGEDILVGPAAE